MMIMIMRLMMSIDDDYDDYDEDENDYKDDDDYIDEIKMMIGLSIVSVITYLGSVSMYQA